MAKGSCKIVAIEHLSLDGVYQAPARTNEDARGGFQHGGWAMAGEDPKMQEVIGKYIEGGWSLLAGRTTYEDLLEAWPIRQPDHPMTQALNNVQKFVVSRNPAYGLSWDKSTLLAGEAIATVAQLKRQHDPTLVVFGSGVLVRSLMEGGLIDEFVLMLHPLVLGTGRRLFDAFAFMRFKLSSQLATDSGVIVATYSVH